MGEDRVTVELIKYMGNQGNKELLEVLNITEEKIKFTKLNIAKILPIHRKEEIKDCSNNREISLPRYLKES